MERLREYAKVDISDTKVLYLRYYEQFFRIKMIISGNVLHASTTIHDVIISDVIWVATQRWVVHNQKCILRRMAYTLKSSRLDFYINCFTEIIFRNHKIQYQLYNEILFYLSWCTYMSQGNKIIFTQKNQRSMLEAKIAMYIIYFQPENNPFTRK